MRSKFIKKAYVRTNSAKTSHNSFLLIRLEGEPDHPPERWPRNQVQRILCHAWLLKKAHIHLLGNQDYK